MCVIYSHLLLEFVEDQLNLVDLSVSGHDRASESRRIRGLGVQQDSAFSMNRRGRMVKKAGELSLGLDYRFATYRIYYSDFLIRNDQISSQDWWESQEHIFKTSITLLNIICAG